MMMIGDNIVSGTRTSPLALNMVLEEWQNQSPLYTIWRGQQEPLLPESIVAELGLTARQFEPEIHVLIDTPFTRGRYKIRDTEPTLISHTRIHSAYDLYSEAEQIYLAHGIRRGAGLAQLRKFCVLHMHILQPAYVWAEDDTFHEPMAKLPRKLDDTVYGCGDPMLEKICLIHAAIWNIRHDGWHDGFWVNGWAQENLTFVFTRLWGLIARQIGQYYHYFCGSYRLSVRCLQIAYGVFAQVGDRNPGLLASCLSDAAESLIDTQTYFGHFSDAQGEMTLLQTILAHLCMCYEEAEKAMPFRKVICKKLKLKLLFQKRTLQRFLLMYARTAATSKFLSESTMRALIAQIHESVNSKQDVDWAITQSKYLDFLISCQIKDSAISSTILGTCIESDFELWLLEFKDSQMKVEVALKLIERWNEPEDGEKLRIICTRILTSLVTDYFSSDGEQEIERLKAFFEDSKYLEPFSSSWRAAFTCSEACLELCIRAKLWTLAKVWLEKLESLSPGFSTGTHCPTRFWHWQRRLSLGLILEAEGDFHSALQAFNQSALFALFDFPVDNDIEGQRSLFNIPDMGRIIPSLARIYLRLDEAKSDIPDLKDLSLGKYNLLSQSDHKGYGTYFALEALELLKARHITDVLAIHRTDIAADVKARWFHNYRDMKLFIEPKGLNLLRTPNQEKELDDLRQKYRDAVHEVRKGFDLLRAAQGVTRKFNIELMQRVLRGATIVVFTCLSENGLGLFLF